MLVKKSDTFRLVNQATFQKHKNVSQDSYFLCIIPCLRNFWLRITEARLGEKYYRTHWQKVYPTIKIRGTRTGITTEIMNNTRTVFFLQSDVQTTLAHTISCHLNYFAFVCLFIYFSASGWVCNFIIWDIEG